jgi:predicted DNA-binding WGR domain protein
METAFPSPDSVPYRANLMAFDPQKNVARAWRVEVERDLFGHVVVSTEWGRIGSRGQHKRISFSDDVGALSHVRSLLRRRGTLKRRIGVAYRLVPSG